MAAQQPAPRPWFRLASLSRPVLPITPTPEPPPPQTRAPMALPPALRPQPPQEPTQAPAFPAASAPAAGVSSVPTSPSRRTSVPSSPEAPSAAAPPLPPSPPADVVSSVPTSPIRRTSVPSSPGSKSSPTPTMPSPATTTSSVPSSPKTQLSAPSPSPKPAASPPKPSTSSMPTSPVKPEPTFLAPRVPRVTATIPTTVTVTTRVPSPTPSLRTLKPLVQTPSQPPTTKPTAPPPSPLTLPPPQLKSRDELEHKIPEKTEQKTVLVQKNIEKPKPWGNVTEISHKDFHETRHKNSVAHHFHRHEKHEVHKDDGKKEKGHRKKFSSDSDREVPMKVITIAGENKGAFMEVIKSPTKHAFDGNSHTLKGNAKSERDAMGWLSYSSSSSSSGEEGKIKMKDKSHKGKAMLSPPMGAFMNSNVQGVNNSIVFNSSCSHHDPGVHLGILRNPFGDGFHVKEKSNGHHS